MEAIHITQHLDGDAIPPANRGTTESDRQIGEPTLEKDGIHQSNSKGSAAAGAAAGAGAAKYRGVAPYPAPTNKQPAANPDEKGRTCYFVFGWLDGGFAAVPAVPVTVYISTNNAINA